MSNDPELCGTRRPTVAEWKRLVSTYEQPNTWRAVWQVFNSIGPYILLWYLMYRSLWVSWLLTVPLAMAAGVLLVRIFIIFHDCGHGSFLKNRLVNDVVGFFAGVLTLTPYYHWRWQHALHHGTAGDLDRRGKGDVWTMTVREYLEASLWHRFAYRLSRNPIVLFVFAPLYVFLIRQRIPAREANERERHSVWWMNLAITANGVLLSWLFGFFPYLVIQLIITTFGGAAGVWLFYVQHQFEHAYWERSTKWDYTAAALQGSSYYKLPAVLRWLSGNIGYHHIHHLSAKIPNYHLKRCHDSNVALHPAKPLTLSGSLKALKLRLWDERLGRLVSLHGSRTATKHDAAAGTAQADDPPDAKPARKTSRDYLTEERR